MKTLKEEYLELNQEIKTLSRKTRNLNRAFFIVCTFYVGFQFYLYGLKGVILGSILLGLGYSFGRYRFK